MENATLATRFPTIGTTTWTAIICTRTILFLRRGLTHTQDAPLAPP